MFGISAPSERERGRVAGWQGGREGGGEGRRKGNFERHRGNGARARESFDPSTSYFSRNVVRRMVERVYFLSGWNFAREIRS